MRVMSYSRSNSMPGGGTREISDSRFSNLNPSSRIEFASGPGGHHRYSLSDPVGLDSQQVEAATLISGFASANPRNYPGFSPTLPPSSMREDTNSLVAAGQLLASHSPRDTFSNRPLAPAGFSYHPAPSTLPPPPQYRYDGAAQELVLRRPSLEEDMSMDERGNSSSGSQETALGLMQLHHLPQLPPIVPAKPTQRPNKLTPSAKAKGKGKARKSHDDDQDELESDFEGKKPAKPKVRKPATEKKKTSRACGACQKAHLTCDDARPCARCVKKGCPDQCQDGARKKAKYLQEIPDELLERRPSNPPPPPLPVAPAIRQADAALPPPTVHPPPVENSTQSFSFDTMPFYDSNAFANEFGSEAANLEYAILSSMLNGNGFAVNGNDQYGGGGPTGFSNTENGNAIMMHSPGGRNLIDTNGRTEGAVQDPTLGAAGAIASTSRGGYTNSIFDRAALRSPPPTAYGQVLSPPRLQDAASADLFQAVSAGLKASSTPFAPQNGPTLDSPAIAPPEVPAAYPGRTAQSVKPLTSEEAYRTVTKPYPYAQSYHYLVQHLKERFEKNDILRIIRALATFRPSLIALQMPLSEEDETFVERTFQRTLVELNKLISFSGTPTVVWRRTGEICLVGTEFCLLTGWSREELLGKKYIFELFDTGSVVEYYESFAKHAFESTSSSVMTQCVVLGPSGRPVPCAFCFSVRRDLFSCPFLVIGSFLPVLV